MLGGMVYNDIHGVWYTVCTTHTCWDVTDLFWPLIVSICSRWLKGIPTNTYEGKQFPGECLIAKPVTKDEKTKDLTLRLASYLTTGDQPAMCTTRNTVPSIYSIAKTLWPSPVPRKIPAKAKGGVSTRMRGTVDARYGNGDELQIRQRGVHRRDS